MNYEQIFALRGHHYHQAMLAFPDARRQEFQQVIDQAHLQEGSKVGDLPAGGQYLKAYLPPGSHYYPHEPCNTFVADVDADTDTQAKAAETNPLLPLPWPEGHLDCVISLAGVHHLEDKAPLFKAIYQVLKPGGRLILSDVAQDSREAAFLDHQVGTYNVTGHQGHYLNEHTAATLAALGFEVIFNQRVQCDWQFSQKGDIGDFCHRLFGMIQTTPSQVNKLAEQHLKPYATAAGHWLLPWQLQTLVACKP